MKHPELSDMEMELLVVLARYKPFKIQTIINVYLYRGTRSISRVLLAMDWAMQRNEYIFNYFKEEPICG